MKNEFNEGSWLLIWFVHVTWVTSVKICLNRYICIVLNLLLVSVKMVNSKCVARGNSYDKYTTVNKLMSVAILRINTDMRAHKIVMHGKCKQIDMRYYLLKILQYKKWLSWFIVVFKINFQISWQNLWSLSHFES